MILDNLIKNHIDDNDKKIFLDITGCSVDNLVNQIKKNVSIVDEILSNKKHVKSSLDDLGLHVFRIILARKIHLSQQDFFLKKTSYDSVVLEHVNKVNNVGFTKINDFDPTANIDNFKTLESIIQVLHPRSFKNKNIDNKLKKSKVISDIYKSKNISIGKYNKDDPNIELHCDTFHPAYKIFIYYDEVTIEKGPFSYVPESNSLSYERLKVLFDISKNASCLNKDNYKNLDKSFKVLYDGKKCKYSNEVDMFTKSFGMKKEIIVTGKKYTTIIADVSGFHRRYNSLPNTIRPNKRFSIVRNNPFQK